MDDFKKRFREFAEKRGRSEDKITELLKVLANSEVLVLPDILASDLAKLKSKFNENDVRFLLGFIRSLTLDKAVLGAIGLKDPEDVEKIIKSKYKGIADLLDRFRSEVAIEQAFSIEPPASSRLWKFTERFLPNQTGKDGLKL